ncbi:MAG: hypothetical protein KGH72_01790 [Candidatus Micrarchaeota archaeon]|nr:hypothetical protein [Candidatus Micrarchaeota archaeon]
MMMATFLLVYALLSLGSIDALIPLFIILILIAAAAGATRGFSVFNLFGIGTLLGIGTGAKGSITGKTALSLPFYALPFSSKMGMNAGARLKRRASMAMRNRGGARIFSGAAGRAGAAGAATAMATPRRINFNRGRAVVNRVTASRGGVLARRAAGRVGAGYSRATGFARRTANSEGFRTFTRNAKIAAAVVVPQGALLYGTFKFSKLGRSTQGGGYQSSMANELAGPGMKIGRVLTTPMFPAYPIGSRLWRSYRYRMDTPGGERTAGGYAKAIFKNWATYSSFKERVMGETKPIINMKSGVRSHMEAQDVETLGVNKRLTTALNEAGYNNVGDISAASRDPGRLAKVMGGSRDAANQLIERANTRINSATRLGNAVESFHNGEMSESDLRKEYRTYMAANEQHTYNKGHEPDMLRRTVAGSAIHAVYSAPQNIRAGVNAYREQRGNESSDNSAFRRALDRGIAAARGAGIDRIGVSRETNAFAYATVGGARSMIQTFAGAGEEIRAERGADTGFRATARAAGRVIVTEPMKDYASQVATRARAYKPSFGPSRAGMERADRLRGEHVEQHLDDIRTDILDQQRRQEHERRAYTRIFGNPDNYELGKEVLESGRVRIEKSHTNSFFRSNAIHNFGDNPTPQADVTSSFTPGKIAMAGRKARVEYLNSLQTQRIRRRVQDLRDKGLV